MENHFYLEDLTSRYPKLEPVKQEIQKAADRLILCYREGHKVLVCGNGGSSSDSDHIVGELMKGFENMRPVEETLKTRLALAGGERGKYLGEKLQQALPAISLTAHTALITAVSNDTGADLVFAQQVMGYGNKGDVLIGISTSGNAQNVLDAIITAKAKGLTVIGLTGESGGKMKPLCDILIPVPGRSPAHVQELHMPVYHTLCLMVENHFFTNNEPGTSSKNTG
jgi:D-sedoheptulose 7-phosphate isomerase